MPPTALFVIDIQNDLITDPKTRIPAADRIREAGTRILSVARTVIDSRDPSTPSPLVLVFVQHEDLPGKGPLKKDTEPWGLVFEPRESEDEVLVHKTTRDTFASNPDLAGRLKEMGVKTIVAFGIQSECCVESTCRGALEAGFEVVLLSGAHSTYDADGKTAVEIEREVEERLKGLGAKNMGWDREWETAGFF
ncbi:hypothetical protein OQA88_8687 [Cercophora sp. LCS_1]